LEAVVSTVIVDGVELDLRADAGAPKLGTVLMMEAAE
jgi:hypothetical protein